MRKKCLQFGLVLALAIASSQLLFCPAFAEDGTDNKPPVVLAQPGQPAAGEVAAIPVKISVEAPPASSASFLERIFTSGAAVTVYLSIALYALKWASDRYKLDLERWEGIIMHCYSDAEKHGILNSWAGHEKLAHAMQLFDERFRSVFGISPTASDREDARLDFARTAFNDDASTPAPSIHPE